MQYEADAGISDIFLSNSDGHDVAVLQRLQRTEDRNGYKTDDPLSDEQWQKMIDLVAAAPSMLQAIRHIRAALRDLENWRDMDATEIDQLIASDGLVTANEAIRKATGSHK